MHTFETFMQKYKSRYWILKNEDSVFNAVNQTMYLFLRKGQLNNKEQVTIGLHSDSPRMDEYESNNNKLYLVMTHGKQQIFNNRIKKLKESNIDFISSSSDDGGSIVFMEEDLDVVAQVFKIKKKQRRNLTEEQRQELSERLAAMLRTKRFVG